MRIGICDDDALARERLTEWVKEHPKAETFEVCTYANGEAMLADGAGFDLVLLDVELGAGLGGLEVARQLQMRNRNVITIFVSGNAGYVRQMPHYNGFNFLLKGAVDREAFHEELAFALEKYQQEHWTHTIYQNGEAIEVPVGQIVFVQADDREIEYFVQGMSRESYKVYGSIRETGLMLASFGVIRCHKSYLVNVRYIQGSAGETVQVEYISDGRRMQRQLPVSRRERKKVQEAIRHQISGKGGR